MITGTISRRRALVNLAVRSPGGQERQVEFILDTGFTGMLTLPPTTCAALGLAVDRLQPVFVADGTRIMVDVYLATLLWEGGERTVEVLGTAGPPLLGMTLLDGCDVHLRVVDGGLVVIQRP
jgi:clan AA aspartic protease